MIWGTTKPPLGTKINWSHPLSRGIVACWPMNEGCGNKIYDSSGNGMDGVIENYSYYTTNAPFNWNPGKFGKDYYFSGGVGGVANKITFSNSDILNLSTFSFSAWYRIVNSAGYYGGQFCNRVAGKNGFQFVNDNEASPFCPHLVVYNGTSETKNIKSSVTFTMPMPDFVHFIWTHSGGDVKLYINGVNTTTSNGVTSWGAGLVQGVHAGYGWGTLGYMNGLIDIPVIYNRVLSETEAKTLYMEPFCMFND